MEAGKVHRDGTIEAFGRRFQAGIFPIGIDTRSVARFAEEAATSSHTKRLRDSLHGRDLMIGVDRLDYSKGLVALSLPFIPSIAETLEFCITTGYPFRHA